MTLQGSSVSHIRVAALLLILGLLAGPLATHVYWLLGGTWGLYTDGVRDEVASTGTRVIAGVVIVLLVFAVAVVLARVGFWRQTFVSERLIRFFAWVLAAVFVLEAVAALTWSRGTWGWWWMYGPVSFVIALLASIVASSDGARPRVHRSHRKLASR